MHLVLHGSRYAMYTCVHIKHWTCDRYLWALGLWICVEAKSTSMSSVDSFSAEDELKKLSQRLGCKIGILSCTYVIEYVCWLCCMIVQYALMHSHSRICKVLHVSLWQPLQGLTRVLVLRSFCGKNPFVLLHRLSQLQWNPLRRSVLKLMMQVMNNHHWFRNPWWLSWKKAAAEPADSVSWIYMEFSKRVAQIYSKLIRRSPVQYGLKTFNSGCSQSRNHVAITFCSTRHLPNSSLD